jgi:hypothetical protein
VDLCHEFVHLASRPPSATFAIHAVILAADSAQRQKGTPTTAIRVAVYNFCGVHSTLKCTPAMAAGIIDTLWSLDDLYDAVTQPAAEAAVKAKRDRRIQRLIDRLQQGE